MSNVVDIEELRRAKEKIFQCSHCGETFIQDWTEEEAQAQRKENGWEDTECDIVCEDCYNEVMMASAIICNLIDQDEIDYHINKED